MMREGLLNDLKMHVDEYRVNGGLERCVMGMKEILEEKIEDLQDRGYGKKLCFYSALFLGYCS